MGSSTTMLATVVVLLALSCSFIHTLPLRFQVVQAIRCGGSNQTVEISPSDMEEVGDCQYPEGRNREFCDVRRPASAAIDGKELYCSSNSNFNTDVMCYEDDDDGATVCHCQYREEFVYEIKVCTLYQNNS